MAVLDELLQWRPGLLYCKRRPDEEDCVPVSGISVRRILQSGGISTWHQIRRHTVSLASSVQFVHVATILKNLLWQLILSFRWTAIGGCGEITSTHILFFRYLNRSYPCYSDNTMAPTQSPSVYGGICDYVKCTTESTPCQCDSSDCPNPLGLVVGCTKPIETCETKDVEPYLSTRIYDYGDVVVSSDWKSYVVVVFFASLILCYLSNSESAWIDTPA